MDFALVGRGTARYLRLFTQKTVVCEVTVYPVWFKNSNEQKLLSLQLIIDNL